MSDDWQPGDLALCVAQGPDPEHWSGKAGGPRLGGVYVVERVEIEPFGDYFPAGLYLAFADFPDSFFHEGFRKIRPHAPDAEDAETIRLLNGAPVREPV